MVRARIFPIAEYDDRNDATRRAETYRELEWVRFHKGYKPGWTRMTYKDVFGSWPDAWMESLTPMPASAAIEKWVRSRVNAWKKQYKEGRKRERDARAKVLGRVAPAEETNDYQRGNEPVEGQPALPFMARGGSAEGDR
jgi:hypothetical protein